MCFNNYGNRLFNNVFNDDCNIVAVLAKFFDDVVLYYY